MIKGSHHTPESIEKMRVKHANKTLTEEHKVKIRANSPHGEKCHLWTGGNISRICIECGKEFTTTKWEVKIGGGKFCSRECMGVFRSKHYVGENHPFWKGGISFGKYCQKFNKALKGRVRGWFNNECLECKEPLIKENLIVHHVYYNKKTCCTETEDGHYIHTLPEGEKVEVLGDPNKFVLICRSCHAKTNFDRLYWARHFEWMINDYFQGKSYFTEEEFDQYTKP